MVEPPSNEPEAKAQAARQAAAEIASAPSSAPPLSAMAFRLSERQRRWFWGLLIVGAILSGVLAAVLPTLDLSAADETMSVAELRTLVAQQGVSIDLRPTPIVVAYREQADDPVIRQGLLAGDEPVTADDWPAIRVTLETPFTIITRDRPQPTWTQAILAWVLTTAGLLTLWLLVLLGVFAWLGKPIRRDLPEAQA